MSRTKEQAIKEEFDARLFALCVEMRRRIGAVHVASTLVVHSARVCSELGADFEKAAMDAWQTTTRDFRKALESKAKVENAETKH